MQEDFNAYRMSGLVAVFGLCFVVFGISDESMLWGDMAITYFCVVVIFVMQWTAFLPACLAKSERFYDLVGSATYIIVSVLALFLAQRFDPRSLLVTTLVLVWASRLGWFLFSRVSKSGGDSRFDRIKHKPLRFFIVWTMQGIWVLICLSPVLATISAKAEVVLSYRDIPAVLIAISGFLVEVIADYQKRIHRNRYGADVFITTGLWNFSRHPNYFGEICFWFGVTMIALPALSGFSYVSLVAPIFVYFLLTKISGTVLLEQSGLKKWGDDQLYQNYIAETPLLWPFRL